MEFSTSIDAIDLDCWFLIDPLVFGFEIIDLSIFDIYVDFNWIFQLVIFFDLPLLAVLCMQLQSCLTLKMFHMYVYIHTYIDTYVCLWTKMFWLMYIFWSVLFVRLKLISLSWFSDFVHNACACCWTWSELVLYFCHAFLFCFIHYMKCACLYPYLVRVLCWFLLLCFRLMLCYHCCVWFVHLPCAYCCTCLCFSLAYSSTCINLHDFGLNYSICSVWPCWCLGYVAYGLVYAMLHLFADLCTFMYCSCLHLKSSLCLVFPFILLLCTILPCFVHFNFQTHACLCWAWIITLSLTLFAFSNYFWPWCCIFFNVHMGISELCIHLLPCGAVLAYLIILACIYIL